MLQAIQCVASGVATGDLTPSEAVALSGFVEAYRRTLETEIIERRLSDLEQRLASK